MERVQSSESQSTCASRGEFQRNDKIWKRYVKRASKYDDRMIEHWTQSIDVLLVFAALFSAIVTAFLLNASTALQRDTPSVTNDILLHISQQLSSPSNRTFIIPAATLPQERFIPARNDIFVCIMLFVSLALCVVASAGGLLAKLWLLAYRKSVNQPGGPYDRALNRQRAFSAIKSWYLGTIIEMLPGLVLLSLILFFLALHASIEKVQFTIGYTIGVLFAAAVTFGFTTSVAATFIPDCPFKTPFSQTLKIFSDFILPKNTLRYAGSITLVCGLVGSGIIFLMAFVSTRFTLGLSLPGIIQIAMLRDVRQTMDGYPMIGFPLWVAATVTVPVILFSIAGYFYQLRYVYLGVCFVIGIPWVYQGYRMAKKPGPLVADTVETEALAWYLQEKLSSPFSEFQRAATHADTLQRKLFLSNALFPLIASRAESHFQSLSESEVDSILECMMLLTDFKLQKSSLWENTAAVEHPDNWEQLLGLLDRIPGREGESHYLREKLSPATEGGQKQKNTRPSPTSLQASMELEMLSVEDGMPRSSASPQTFSPV